ncbi:uncharacterized protein LOC135226374 [Macrobrachium nipponense]|uniref:uncharacterized protein LOC135226374 n=1 Tax=Macrobrachium nipponense TaxID=159736 RepID=UPI0030C847F7
MKPLSGLFNCVEDLTTGFISLTGRYVATPLANRIGGWQNIDSWACQILDKLESAVPQLKEPTLKIEESVFSKIKGLLDDVYDSDDDSGYIFLDSDESEPEVVESYDTVCHGKDDQPCHGTDYETGEEDEALFVRGGGGSLEAPKTQQRRSSSLPTPDHLRSPGLSPGQQQPSSRFSLSHGSSSENSDSNEGQIMSPWWRRVFRKARRSTHTRESPDGKQKKVDDANGSHQVREEEEEEEEEEMKEREKSVNECELNSTESETESKSKIMLEMNGEIDGYETDDVEGKFLSDGEETHTPFKTPRTRGKSLLNSSDGKMSNSPSQQELS